jgi:hypothetical protein
VVDLIASVLVTRPTEITEAGPQMKKIENQWEWQAWIVVDF